VKNNRSRFVDVFWGAGVVDLPKPQGIAAKWRFIKGLAGNTTPAAARPFGKITACSYSGGYSSGYGNSCINTGPHRPPLPIMPANTVRGFSHLQQSGTGYIDSFYNYAVVAPTYEEDVAKAFEPEIMTDEAGRPGYYAAAMRGVLFELTVSDRAAHHRITFPKAGGKLVFDFTNDGLFEEKTRMAHEDLRAFIIRPDLVEVRVVLQKLELNFCVCCPGAQAKLWEKGCYFEVLPAATVRMALGVSPKSMDIAREGALEATMDFDSIAAESAECWEKAFSSIEIETDNERDMRLFYSAFYHTLIKPANWHGESFLYEDEDAFMLDFATLWDQYKTQMPLLFTLYPHISEEIVRTILAYCRVKKRMPHTLMLERTSEMYPQRQARMLAEHVLADACFRGVSMDIAEAVRCIRTEIMNPEYFADFKETGVCKHSAQTIDMADGCNASAALARLAGDEELADYCAALAAKWPAAFDQSTGLLKTDSWFYEGNHWNYSFRLMHDMARRLNIAGGKDSYAKLLDHFFGFDLPEGEKADFEGFNNETDMETPYAYYYADRHDRICEVVHAGLDYMFCEGRSGCPGNNDSGGLSSLCMWNMMGIFPVSGQNLMLLSSPRVKSAKIRLASGNTFSIRREGTGIYVQKAIWNGKELDTMAIPADEMMKGGELTFVMKQQA